MFFGCCFNEFFRSLILMSSLDLSVIMKSIELCTFVQVQIFFGRSLSMYFFLKNNQLKKQHKCHFYFCIVSVFCTAFKWRPGGQVCWSCWLVCSILSPLCFSFCTVCMCALFWHQTLDIIMTHTVTNSFDKEILSHFRIVNLVVF